MTIQTAINRIDEMKSNMFSDAQKIAWLSEVDGYVWKEIILTHEGVAPGTTFEGYDQDTEMDTELLVPAPYTPVYEHYLAAQMDLKNAEPAKYAQSMVLFNNAWQTYGDYYGRLHMPIHRVKQLRF